MDHGFQDGDDPEWAPGRRGGKERIDHGLQDFTDVIGMKITEVTRCET